MRLVYYYRHINDSMGSGTHATSLVREWARMGNAVACLPRPASAPAVRLDRTTASSSRLVATVPAGLRHELRYLEDNVRSLRESPRLLQELRALGPDVLIARRSHFDRTLDRLLDDGVACPVVAEVNAVHDSEWRRMLGTKLPAGAVRREAAFLRRVRFSICVSEEIRQELLTLGVDPARCAVVPNGADCELFSPEAKRDDGLTSWLDGRPGPLVAYCGSASMMKVHDMDCLLRAAERLAVLVPDSLFLFVGPLVPAVDELLKQAPDLATRVHVTGAVPHAKVPSFLAAADLTWAAYRNVQGSPLKAFEYLAMGKPSVAAAAGQARQVLEESGGGTAVPTGSHRELADAAAHILSLPEGARRALGASARRWVVANRSWSATAATMLTLIRERVLPARP